MDIHTSEPSSTSVHVSGKTLSKSGGTPAGITLPRYDNLGIGMDLKASMEP
jgi:hypothetical protein